MLRPAVVALAVGLAACSGNSPSEQDYDDIAEMTTQMLNNESGGDVDSLGVVLTVSTEGELPRGFSGSVEGFENTVLGVEYTYAVRCRPGACGDGTTGASVDVRWNGSLETLRFQADLEREGSWEVEGLDLTAARFDGDSSIDVTTSFTPLLVDRSSNFRASFDATYDALEVDLASLLPVTGRIEYRLKAERFAEAGDDKAEAEFDVTLELEVTGSGTATLTIDGDYAYDVDLDNGTYSASDP